MIKLFDKYNNRLIFVRQSGPDFWDTHWSTVDIKKFIFSISRFSMVVRITKKFLKPTDGPILEAGCGIGQNVFVLTREGYRCIGIDNARKTVQRVKQQCPEIDIRFQDIRKLEFEIRKKVKRISLVPSQAVCKFTCN